MTELLKEHPEFAPLLLGLGWAIIAWIKARTAATYAQKGLLAVSDAIEQRGDSTLKRMITATRNKLTASGDDKTAQLIADASATVDDKRPNPSKNLQEKYENMELDKVRGQPNV